jgi:hypothetical protein
MIYTLPNSTPGSTGGNGASSNDTKKKRCSCAKSNGAPAAPHPSKSAVAMPQVLGQTTGPSRPLGNNLFQVPTRQRRAIAIPQGSNFYRKASSVPAKRGARRLPAGAPPSRSRSRAQGLGQDDGAPSTDITLTPPDLTSFDTLPVNQDFAVQLASAGAPPGVTPSQYASFITGATGVPVNLPATGANTPAPITSQGLNPAYAATLNSAVQLAEAVAGGYLPQGTTSVSTAAATTPSWFSQASIVSGVPNWAILAGGGGLLLVILAAGRNRKR